MQGCRFLIPLAVLSMSLIGCDDPVEFDPQTTLYDQPQADLGSEFDEKQSGTIYGEVLWSGPTPIVESFLSTVTPRDYTLTEFHDWPNPNEPVLHPKTGGVRHAVVFLKGIDPRKSRPWDLSPVKVMFEDYQMKVVQGDTTSRVGFVRRGTTIEMINRGPRFEGAICRGASFFSVPLPDIDEPQLRRFDDVGVVELASSATRFWQRSYLFVDDHPYYTRTDDEGRFLLLDVPPGQYELVCWVPNWHPRNHIRDGDTSYIRRLWFQPPLVSRLKIEVQPKQTQTLDFRISEDQFRSR